MDKKTYWIGDNKDQKSVCIGSTIFVRGEAIPIEDVEQDRIDEWKKKGLVSGGEGGAPVIVSDTDTVKRLESEIQSLKAELAILPGLQKENKELKAALEKAQSGKKAAKLREFEVIISGLESKLKEVGDVGELNLDIQEKAALIEKLNNDIEALTKPDTDSEDVVHEE